MRVLGETVGKLVVDAYSGYNKVTLPGRRERAGCLAHLRRKFFDAQSAAPERREDARWTSSSSVYKIERAALDADLLGTPEHLEMRQTREPRGHGRVQGVARRRAGAAPAARRRWARRSATRSASGTR